MSEPQGRTSQYLFTVAGVFFLQSRGPILIPGVPAQGPFHVHVGDAIELRRPDGSTQQTTVRGIEMADPPRPSGRSHIPILLPDDVVKGDVPIGTEVWSR